MSLLDDEGKKAMTENCTISEAVFAPFPNYVKYELDNNKNIIIKEKR